MTAPDQVEPTSLLGKLIAAVRGEFRGDVLEFPAGDPVFGGGPCLVDACERGARGLGFCPAHYRRWVDAGRPDPATFASATDPRWRRQQPNQQCRVRDCGYGSARQGLCASHGQRWTRAGNPSIDVWLMNPPPVKQPPPGATCRITHCRLWPQGNSVFCQTHRKTWKSNGKPDVEEFVEQYSATPIPANETIRLHPLVPQLKLEMQYVLQYRHDHRHGTLTPTVIARVVRLLADSGAGSLLDHDEHEWIRRGAAMAGDSRARGFLLYAHRAVSDLAEAGGWDAEYRRDI